MKLKSLMLFLIISATYLIAGSDELPTVELKIYTDCSARKKNNDSLFQYEELRDNILFEIIDPNNLKGITSFGENPNDYSTPQTTFESTYYEDIKTSKIVDTSKKYDYSYIPDVNYFIENSNEKIHISHNKTINYNYKTSEFSAEQNLISFVSVQYSSGSIQFTSEYRNGIHLIEKIFSDENAKFVAKYKLLEGKVTTEKKEVRVKERGKFSSIQIVNGKLVEAKPVIKNIDVYNLEKSETPYVKEYQIVYDKNLLQKVKEKCESSINSQKRSLISKDISIILASLFGLWIVIMFIYGIYTRAKIKASELKIRAHEYKVQKIAEDEAIRATVKKAIENDIDEAKELQELINKVVAKGDTETAQSLLAILERRKDKQ